MSLADLAKPLTADEVKSSIYSALATSGIAATDWKPGAVARTLISVFAIGLASLSELIALIARSGFLELASGPWLDLVAWYVYGVRRIEETFATGFVRVTNLSGASAFVGVPIGDLIVKNSATGATYRNTAVFTLPATIGAYVDVPVQADLVGSEGDAGAGDIAEFVTTFVGCGVENLSSLVGSDAEEDIPLRNRARSKTGVLSPNGPKDAYTYLATSAVRADGTSIGIQRVRCIPDGIGGIDIHVADEDGSTTGTVGDETTDLGIIDRDIQEQAAPLAITARLHAAVPLEVGVSFTLYVADTLGLTSAEIVEAIEAFLTNFFSRVPIGGMANLSTGDGYVNREAIKAAIARTKIVVEDQTRTLGEYISNLDLTAPAADVVVADNEAPVMGNVVGSIVMVPTGPLV